MRRARHGGPSEALKSNQYINQASADKFREHNLVLSV
jgi:hypothetical protein